MQSTEVGIPAHRRLPLSKIPKPHDSKHIVHSTPVEPVTMEVLSKEPASDQTLPPSPPMTTTGRPDSTSSFSSLNDGDNADPSLTTTTDNAPTVAENATGNSQDEIVADTGGSLVLAIRALRVLDNPKTAAAEALLVLDPHHHLHPDLVRLLIAAAARHPDVAQGLIELGQNDTLQARNWTQTNNELVHSQSTTTLQNGSHPCGEEAGRQIIPMLHGVSLSSLMSSLSEQSPRRPSSSAPNEGRPTLRRSVSVRSSISNAFKKTPEEMPPLPPRHRKDTISVETIGKICKANLKDTKECMEKLENPDFEDLLGAAELKKMAEGYLGHETGKFALCLALTLKDEAQRWEATRGVMNTMADKLKILLTARGRFGPNGDVGLPGQDGFGIRDCWVVLSEVEHRRLATEDEGKWVTNLREVAQIAGPRHATKVWEILATCERLQAEAADPDATPQLEDAPRGSDFANAAPDRWNFFFDLLDQEAARRCFRELKLLRQLFGAAKQISTTGDDRSRSNLKTRAKKAFAETMGSKSSDLDLWLDTKWAITAMKDFMITKVESCDIDASRLGVEAADRLNTLDNTFATTFWECLSSEDCKRLAREDGKQWVTDIMKLFEQRRRYDVMFRMRDILTFMQTHM